MPFKIRPTALFASEKSTDPHDAETFSQAFDRITGSTWESVQPGESDGIGLHIIECQIHDDRTSYLLSNGLLVIRDAEGDTISAGVSLDFYQHHAKKTAKYPGSVRPPLQEIEQKKTALSYLALGLMGEAGEYAEKVKKLIRGDLQEQNTEASTMRAFALGDVLWYLSECARQEGASLSWVALNNLDKLASRAERGKLQGQGDAR